MTDKVRLRWEGLGHFSHSRAYSEAVGFGRSGRSRIRGNRVGLRKVTASLERQVSRSYWIDFQQQVLRMPEIIPANVPVDIYIAKALGQVADLPTPVIAIVPVHDNWNDYGRNFFARLHIRAEGVEPIEIRMRLMFEGVNRSEFEFTRLLNEHGDVFLIDVVETPFASLLVDVEHYQQVIGALGFEVGVSALRKLHDATVARTEGVDQALLDLIDGEEFHFGALRNGGAYDSLRRGSRFFRPDIPAPVEDAAINFVFSAHVRSADNLYTLPFRFNRDGIFRDRASVLIGRNGVGKTQLLKAIVDGLHSNHAAGFLRPHFLPAFRPSRVIVFSSVPTDPFPRWIGPWHGIDYEYFAVNASGEEGADPLLVALVACKKSEDRNGFGENRDMSRLDVVEAALDAIGLWDRLHLPLRPGARVTSFHTSSNREIRAISRSVGGSASRTPSGSFSRSTGTVRQSSSTSRWSLAG